MKEINAKLEEVIWCDMCNTIIPLTAKDDKDISDGYKHFDEVHCEEGFHPDDDWADFEADNMVPMKMLSWNCPKCKAELKYLWDTNEDHDYIEGSVLICTCGESQYLGLITSEAKRKQKPGAGIDQGKVDG